MSIVLFMLMAIFGVRPLMMIAHQDYTFYGGTDISAGFVTASIVGLVAATFAVFGYGLGVALRKTHRPTSDRQISPMEPRIGPALLSTLLLLLIWLILMVILGGGISYLELLFAGRSDATEARVTGMPAIVPALPVVGALLVAVTRIRIERIRRFTRVESIQYWLVVALTVVPPTALGSRRFLIPSLVAALLGVLPPVWNRRVSLRMLALGALGFIAMAIIPYVRSAGSRTGRTDLLGAMGDYLGAQGIGGTITNFFLSYDTEMFDYVALLSTHLGRDLEYGWGRGSIGDALLAPIPAALSPIARWSDQILLDLYGGPCGISYCPVPSTPGIMFYDFGLPGVLVGMTLLGVALSRWEMGFLRAEGAALPALLTLGAFMPQVIRGNSIAQLWIAAQVLVLLLLLYKASQFLSRAATGSRGRNSVLAGHTQRQRTGSQGR